MSNSKDSLSRDFWKSLNNNHRFDELNNLKSYIAILVFLKHISDNENTIKDLNITIPEECDFQTIQKICDYEISYIGNDVNIGDEINGRINLIAKTNPILDGVINFVDFTNPAILGEGYNQNIVLGKIIRLMEDYENSLVSSNTLSKTTWVELYEYLMQSFTENSGKYSAGISTPNEIGVLIAKLFDIHKQNEVKSIYDPIFDKGNLLFSVFQEVDSEVNLYGEEINSENVFLAKLKFLFHGISNYTFKTDDVLKSPGFIDFSREKNTFLHEELYKFDYVVSCPPFYVKDWFKDPHGDYFNRWNTTTGIPPNSSADFAYILHVINSLKKNGTGACLVSNGALFRGGSERDIRKYLIDNGFIKGIIGLPAKLFYGTGIPCSIIILGNQPNDTNKDVFIIEGASEFLEGKLLNKILPENINRIAGAWVNRKEEKTFSRLVSYNEIVENDYNLNVPRYLLSIEEFETPKDSIVVELSSLLSTVPRIRTNNESGKLIKITDLSNDSFLYEIDFDKLNTGDVLRSFIKLETPALLISKRFNRLKPSFCSATIENPVYISPEIEAFSINDNVDLSYLIIQLSSDYVTKQAEVFSGGGIMPNIKKDDLLKIKIIVPDLNAQESIIRQKALAEGARIQSDKSKIESLQLQSTIDTLLKERMNDFQWKLHDIRNGELLNLKGQIVTLEMFADANPTIFDTILDKESNETVHSYIKDIYTSVQKLAVILSDLYDTSDNASIKEDTDILVFIKEFCANQLKNNNNLFEIDDTDIDIIKDDFDIKNLVVSVNKNDLQRIFTNIFVNAIKHGFNDSNQNNKIKVALSLDSKKEVVTIAVLNNGKPSKISEIDYFADGGKAGSSSNSGKGGHIVKVLTERNNGKAFQNNYTIEEAGGYTFEVGVQFNYNFLYEL